MFDVNAFDNNAFSSDSFSISEPVSNGIYVYQTFNIKSPVTLLKVLRADVDPDAHISGNGHLEIHTETGTQEQVDAALAKTAPDTLFAIKLNREKQVSIKSTELEQIGVDTWVAGVKIECTPDNLDNHQSKLIYYQGHTDKLSASAPYIVFGTDGTAITTSNIADIAALVDRLADRLIYLYTSLTTGEAGLLGQIQAATTIEEVKAITDTRV